MAEDPDRCCDLVMKGGISSGVVFPSAITEVARQFHLVGIGGTSAGAIAGTLAAAAEYRRRQGGGFAGFDRIEEIARQLGEKGFLLELFRPDRETRKIFEVMLEVLSGEAGLAKVAWKLRFRFKKALQLLVDNGFGVCSGMAVDNRSPKYAPLTEWLADRIDEVAGRSDGDPLTFEDLHTAAVPAGVRGLLGEAPERSIDLRCVTTCLTFGRPLELPFRENLFAFDPAEWRRLFPARIVDYLVREQAAIETETLRADGKLPLPRLRLPIVVAARMSLSFPGLFSAVPLWARDYNQESEPLDRVWLSDGGITSNFPMHRFDNLYPVWPTLGINLQYEPGKGAGPGRRRLRREGTWVYMAKRRNEGTVDLWNRLATGGSSLGSLGGFAGSLLSSAKDWHDNSYLKLPGYRDRVVEIWLESGRGGLNLEMEPADVQALIARGREAGKSLVDRFAVAPETDAMSWNGHRWFRYRSAMAGLVEALRSFEEAVGTASPGAQSLQDLLASLDAPPTKRFRSETQRREAEAVTEKLLALAAEIEAATSCAKSPRAKPFCGGPRPWVEIGTRPPI